ncbi:MAG TPA: type II toxin-antitoxin system PemK/MazF family toxin [Thermoanaerobaculia bacterium]|nr:type II toxin-antitoxin system PemK/MazF family toxin [Thermoanaerobaculia bacterium]
MVAAPEPRRGEIWWAVADKRRPVVVVQADFLNRSRVGWILAVPLTTALERSGAPGNVRLSQRESGLKRASVANVSQLAPLPRAGFRELVGSVSRPVLSRIESGLTLVLGLE